MKSTFHLPSHGYTGRANVRDFTIVMDEPLDLHGHDMGATPMEYLLSSLGGCIAITLRMYAQRKGWDTGAIDVYIDLLEVEDGSKKIIKTLRFENDLDEDQLTRLRKISEKCPVSKLIQQATTVELRTEGVEGI